MGTHLQIYAAWLWELCTAPVLPFRFEPVAQQVIDRLAELSGPGKAVGLDGVQARAEAFAAAARRLDAQAETWAGRFAKGEGDEAAAQLLNRTMKRLSRMLVPLQSQVKGGYAQDPYGFTPQTTMLPCLYELPELERTPDGPERWMLETKLVRQRNRVADGLGDAAAVIDDTLAALG
jgi:hypothetical protein